MRPLLNHGTRPRFSRIAIYVLAFIVTTGAAMAAAVSILGIARLEGILEDAGLTFVLGGLPIIFGFGVVWYMHHTFERLK
jgi:hypothetical protein